MYYDYAHLDNLSDISAYWNHNVFLCPVPNQLQSCGVSPRIVTHLQALLYPDKSVRPPGTVANCGLQRGRGLDESVNSSPTPSWATRRWRAFSSLQELARLTRVPREYRGGSRWANSVGDRFTITPRRVTWLNLCYTSCIMYSQRALNQGATFRCSVKSFHAAPGESELFPITGQFYKPYMMIVQGKHSHDIKHL